MATQVSCKAQGLQPVTNANFRNDLNASGVITTGDVNIIKQNALSQLTLSCAQTTKH